MLNVKFVKLIGKVGVGTLQRHLIIGSAKKEMVVSPVWVKTGDFVFGTFLSWEFQFNKIKFVGGFVYKRFKLFKVNVKTILDKF